MCSFSGILRHEISMSLRRKGLWIAYGLLFVFHTVLLFSPPPIGEMVKGEVIARREVWQVAGRFLLACNVFFPVVAGILSADRVRRDFRLGLRELQDSTPLSRHVYVLAKYFGSLASSLFPLFLWVMGIAAFMAIIGRAHGSMLYAVPVAFLAITVPAFAFVVAFSLACPMVMPLSIYQILFTGYWFWANFIPPKLFPTLNPCRVIECNLRLAAFEDLGGAPPDILLETSSTDRSDARAIAQQQQTRARLAIGRTADSNERGERCGSFTYRAEDLLQLSH